MGDEDVALEVIERGSAVHCVSTYEGDIIVLGSDGVFDNLFLDEIVDICNEILLPPREANAGNFATTPSTLLVQIAKRIVDASHGKSKVGSQGSLPETPIGRGGKMDDTSVVVGEVVEWTEAHSKVWAQVRRNKQWQNMVSCGCIEACKGWTQNGEDSGEEHELDFRDLREGRPKSPQSRQDSDDEQDEQCSIL